MAIKDYDVIIDMIEENITLEKDVISKMVSKQLVKDERKASEFFQNIDLEQRTLKSYIRDRKILRALGDCSGGETKESVCERYNIDVSNFHRGQKEMFPDKTIGDLRREGFVCAPPLTVKEILQNEGIEMIEKNNDKGSQEIYINEIKRLLSENEILKRNLSEVNMKMIASQRNGSIGENEINAVLYEKFLELEEARIIYGFSIPEVLQKYKESLRSKKSFDKLCSEAHDAYYSEPNNDHPFSYYNPSDEMDAGEAWNYYCGDDDPADMPPDPYAPTAEEMADYHDEFYVDPLAEDYDGVEYEDMTPEQEKEVDELIEKLEAEAEQKKKKPEGREKDTYGFSSTPDDDIPF